MIVNALRFALVFCHQRFERDEGALPHSVCEVLHENEATVSAVIADLKKVRRVEVTAMELLAKSLRRLIFLTL